MAPAWWTPAWCGPSSKRSNVKSTACWSRWLQILIPLHLWPLWPAILCAFGGLSLKRDFATDAVYRQIVVHQQIHCVFTLVWPDQYACFFFQMKRKNELTKDRIDTRDKTKGRTDTEAACKMSPFCWVSPNLITAFTAHPRPAPSVACNLMIGAEPGPGAPS